MTEIAPSRLDSLIKIFGIQTLSPRDIMDGKQAVLVLPKMSDKAVNMSVGCAPISPVIGSPGYLDKPGDTIGYCHSESTDPTSNCNSPVLQMTAPASDCRQTIDDKTGGKPCLWKEIDRSEGYKQVESNSNNPYGNLLMTAPIAAEYLPIKPEWTTILNGGICDYPPFKIPSNCPQGSPGMSPATRDVYCSPSRLKCSKSQGTEVNIYDYVRAIGSPGLTSPPNPCISINPTTDAPSSIGWKDATCSVFYDVLTRAFVSLDTSQPEFGQFPIATDTHKPTIFNNVPFNYDGDAGNPSEVGSYCYRPSPNSCPKIGDVEGHLHGVAKQTQQEDWYAAGFNKYDNTQHLLCEYKTAAKNIINPGPGGFIKNDDDFHAYLNQKVNHDGFFANYQGFPYNDTIYQYIMLEQCLLPVGDDELKDCLGIDGNFGPVLAHKGLKKNPTGMRPETYWNDAYRLDPMLYTKPTDASLECINNCEYRKLNELCAYSPSPCSTCANTADNYIQVRNLCSPGGTGGQLPPATVNRYCTDCQKPMSYAPDSPRCARMNKSTPDGQECRRWYKQTANNYKQAIEKTAQFKQNPEFTRAIYYNNCLITTEQKYNNCLKAPPPAGCGQKVEDWMSPCGSITTAPAVGQQQITYKYPNPWKPYPPELIPGQIPIYKPGPSPSVVDWDKTRKLLHLGSSPGSISTAFNNKAKEFCSKPSSKYLWECGCINASAESPAYQNHYWNIYNAMDFAPAPPDSKYKDSKYKEGYFSATKDQEDAKYCWLQPCKYPFGAGGTDVTNLNDPVRLGDLTLGVESSFQNKDISVCPEYDCESIVVTTPESYIDTTTMTNVISATGADQVCSSVKNAFWIQDPIVCAYGPSSESLTPVYTFPNAPPGYVVPSPGQVRDPGNWCYNSKTLYPAPGSPARKVKWSDQSAYMIEQMCFNGCHNWSPVAVKPQKSQGYAYPTFSCEKKGCVEYLPDSPASKSYANSPAGKESIGLGEFFDPDECKKECMILNKEEKRKLWYVVIIVLAIIAGIFVLLAIRKYLKYKGKVQRYREKEQKSKTMV